MRKTSACIAASVIAIFTAGATAATNSIPHPVGAVPSASGPGSGALKTNVAPTATTGTTTGTGTGTTGTTTGTGTTATNTSTTTTTTTASTAAATSTTAGTNALSNTLRPSVSGTTTGDVLTDARNRNTAAAFDTRNLSSAGVNPVAANGSVPTTTTTTTTTPGQQVVATNGALLTQAPGTTQVVATNGAIMTVDNGLAGAAGNIGANGEILGGGATFSAITPGSEILTHGGSIVNTELTELEKRELRKRRNVPRNKQLLNTIAPRTNVDRTDQMPDDPPTPALATSPLR